MYILTRASEYKVLSMGMDIRPLPKPDRQIRICFGTESGPVCYSEANHYLGKRGPASFIVFFEVPRIAVAIYHAS